MGSDHSDSGENFRREDWEEVERGELATTWQNRRDPTQRIEEYQLHLASQEDCRREQEVYYLRKNHPQLVAALYLYSESTSDFCSSSYQQRLFLQKTPIRLADIEHIPFPDFLHLYSQALRGFAELAQHFGGFPVEEEYVAVNERGVVKVWLNADFSSHHVIGKASQEDMVRSIVEIIERNLDQGQLPQRVPPVRNYLYRNNAKLQFPEAIAELNNFIREFGNGYVPQKLECIDRVGGIYAIANRDKAPQAAPIGQYPASQPQGQYLVEAGRPQLVESGVVSSQYAPRFQNGGATFTAPPTVFAGDDRSVLTPSTVRENVPVVRKQAATFYNYTTALPPNQPIGFEPARTAPVFSFPQPVYTPEPVNVKVGNNTNEPPFNGLNFAYQPPVLVPTGYLPPQVNLNPQVPLPPQVALSADSNANTANNLLRQFNNEPTFIARPNYPPAFPQQLVQQFGNPNYVPNNISPPVIPQANSSVSFSSFNNNVASQGIPNGNGVQQIQPVQQSVDVYAQRTLDAIRNENITPSIPSTPPQLPFFTLPSQDNSSLNVQQSAPSYNFSKNNQVQYGVDVDDGKSSLDFFKRLNEMGSNASYNAQPPNQEQVSQSYSNVEVQRQEYQNPFGFTDSNSSQLAKGGQYSGQYGQEQEFGRSAVSNIITHTAYEGAADRFSEPLKFENNMEMKYSMFQESAPQASYAYRSYETSYDPDLLADLNRQRQ